LESLWALLNKYRIAAGKHPKVIGLPLGNSLRNRKATGNAETAQKSTGWANAPVGWGLMTNLGMR
jgi:hypothetical protein